MIYDIWIKISYSIHTSRLNRDSRLENRESSLTLQDKAQLTQMTVMESARGNGGFDLLAIDIDVNVITLPACFSAEQLTVNCDEQRSGEWW